MNEKLEQLLERLKHETVERQRRVIGLLEAALEPESAIAPPPLPEKPGGPPVGP